MRIIIVIPCYNPDDKLTSLVNSLNFFDYSDIIIVNDGSDKKCIPIFAKLESIGCKVLCHNENKGKGAALKTAADEIKLNFSDAAGFITADCDGQHSPEDIKKIALTMKANLNALILGTRDFSSANVPFKSRFGNKFSSLFFKLSTGAKCEDTQTGLRGIPCSMLESAVNTEGSRYEYEMNFLINAAKSKRKIICVPIKTIYNDNNKGSHFKPVADSIRIFSGPLRFALSSLICAAADISIFTLLLAISNNSISIAMSTVIARLCSGGMNFLLNKKWCFKKKGNAYIQSLRYLILFLSQMAVSAGLVTLLSVIPFNTSLIKIFVDVMLSVISYIIQRNWVFNQNETNSCSQNS